MLRGEWGEDMCGGVVMEVLSTFGFLWTASHSLVRSCEVISRIHNLMTSVAYIYHLDICTIVMKP